MFSDDCYRNYSLNICQGTKSRNVSTFHFFFQLVLLLAVTVQTYHDEYLSTLSVNNYAMFPVLPSFFDPKSFTAILDLDGWVRTALLTYRLINASIICLNIWCKCTESSHNLLFIHLYILFRYLIFRVFNIYTTICHIFELVHNFCLTFSQGISLKSTWLVKKTDFCYARRNSLKVLNRFQ